MATNILVKEKEVVIPGQILAEGMEYLPGQGAFRENDKLISKGIGVVNISGRFVKIIPLSGRYVPKEGDTVIGIVKDMTYSSWFVDIEFVNEAVLSLKEASSDFIERGADLNDYFSIGDYIIAKILKVTKQKAVDITMKGPGLRKITEGRIISVSPIKVPRIIGKQGSMISVIKDATGCFIVVGQNGRIQIRGKSIENEMLAEEAIKKVEAEARTEGLTEIITKFLKERSKNDIQKA